MKSIGGLVEAARAMGANRATIVWDVLIPEALPALSAGFTVTNAETGAAPTTPSVPASGGSTSTTVTVEGSVFTASDATWTVEVVGGSTTAPTTGALKPGEFAVNITVVPTSSLPTTTTG